MIDAHNPMTVAIVTARRDADTSFDEWFALAETCMRGEYRDKHLMGEWGWLLSALWAHQHEVLPCLLSHIRLQTIALEMQTLPIRVDVYNHTKELAAGAPPQGCRHKNEAIAKCQSRYLLFLDDCCIPGFDLCRRALEICERGNIALLPHRKFYLPKKPGAPIVSADANETLDGHIAFGIWAMPIEYLIDLNGFNEQLDGQRDGWDEEFWIRTQRYAAERGIKFEIAASRVYEIEHTYPWDARCDPEWRRHIPVTGWRAPGAPLRERF